MKRFLIVQYAGDFREAYRRLEATGTETYYGHRYVLETLAALAAEFGEAGVMCCRAPERYVERLPTGVTVMGANMRPGLNSRGILKMVAEFDPTHLVVHGPMPHIIRWGVRRGIRTMGMFADSFNVQPLKRFVRYGRIAHLLNNPGVDWVGNHGVNACLSLARLGVDRAKIIPWDWPHDHDPEQYPAKAAPSRDTIPTLLYVGYVSEAKGVGDAIRAMAILKQAGRSVNLEIAGGGAVDRLRQLAEHSGVADQVRFLGLVPNNSILQRMHDASVVIVPSRHTFPEGLPLTIYEALRSRTPIIASDHPMFARNLVDGESCVEFPAADPEALADRVARLLDDPALYGRISQGAPAAWRRIQINGKWGDILHRWLRDEPADRSWLEQYSLDGGLYRDQLSGR